MTEVTDEYMKQMLTRAKTYTIVILQATPKRAEPGADATIWEHGRRNFSLRAEGILPIVCPVSDGTDTCGIGIFDADPERARQIMEEDPGVRAGLFSYELHPGRGFPGSALPA